MRREVQAILRRESATAILVTHDQQEALSFADRVAVMNQGRLEQIGAPEDIFRHPATSFVATFVGHASFIPGRVDGEEIETEIGRFAHEHEVDPPNTDVVVMIRPDDVKLTPDPHGQGTIMSREFHGSRNFYFLTLDSGITVRSRQPSGTIYPSGLKVRVAPKKSAHTMVFPKDQPGLIPRDLPPSSSDPAP